MFLSNRSGCLPQTHSEPSHGGDLSKEEGGGLVEGVTEPHKEEVMEGGFFVSATKKDGLTELQLKIQDEVLKATKQQFFKIVVPADGPQLRYICSDTFIHNTLELNERMSFHC